MDRYELILGAAVGGLGTLGAYIALNSKVRSDVVVYPSNYAFFDDFSDNLGNRSVTEITYSTSVAGHVISGRQRKGLLIISGISVGCAIWYFTWKACHRPIIPSPDRRNESERTDIRNDMPAQSVVDPSSSRDLLCKVCLVNEQNVALLPCGHVFCAECTPRFGEFCPLCRASIQEELRIYN